MASETAFVLFLSLLRSEVQQCPQPQGPQPQQPPPEAPLPGESKEEPLANTHLRSGGGGGGGGGGVDPVKVENIGGGAGRQGSGPPGQGYSKYQKSLPPRFQRQQQVRIQS